MNSLFRSFNVALCILSILVMSIPGSAEDQANYTGECLDIANNVAPPYEMRFCDDFDDYCTLGECCDLMNGGIWQPLSLVTGQTYRVQIQSIDKGSSNAWAEVLVGTTSPVDGLDYKNDGDTDDTPGAIRLLKWSTGSCNRWDGDETSACVGTNMYTFTATADVMYLVLKAGASCGDVNIAFDDVEICGPVTTGIDELPCDDLLDGDSDGATDCIDTDCTGNSDCTGVLCADNKVSEPQFTGSVLGNVWQEWVERYSSPVVDFGGGDADFTSQVKQSLFLSEWPTECAYEGIVGAFKKGLSSPNTLKQIKGSSDYPDTCNDDLHSGTCHSRDIPPVTGTDAEPLTLQFDLDLGPSTRFESAAKSFYVELTDGVDRAPTDYIEVECPALHPPYDFPYLPQVPWDNGMHANALAFGVFALLDTDPCDIGGTNGIPRNYQAALYTGDRWYRLAGSVIDNVPPNFNPNGDMTLGVRNNKFKMVVTSNRIDFELTSRDSLTDVEVTYTAHIEREMDRDENGTPDRWERLYTGPFTKIHVGNGGCIASDSSDVYLDDLALYGGSGVPTLTSAVSRKTHGTAGNWDIDIGAGDIECRSAQIGTVNPNQLKIIATFDMNVAVLGGAAAVTTDVGTVSSVVPGSTPPEVEITITNLPLFGQVNLDFVDNPAAPTAGIVDANSPTDAASASQSNLCFRIIVGDYDNLARTNFLDFAKIKNAGYLNQLVTTVDRARGDFDCNGRPNFLDFAKVKNAGLLNKTAAACVGEEICGDGMDNDRDGLADCADLDCTDDVRCPEDCDNAIDDDADGAIDCADSECDGTPACPEICNDGVDNDADTWIDCQDFDCTNVCVEICNNLADDDADGKIDCADTECIGDALCPESANCLDGVDNDADGLVDCLDVADCNHLNGCPEAPNNCQDGVDNDGDGATDCADTQCVTAGPPCLATENNFSYPSSCTDGIDNDGDGITDCTDSDCVGDMWCFEGGYPGFSPPFCNDGVDNDNDTLTDCADTADCSTDIACSCGNASCEPGYGEDTCTCPADCGTPPATETVCNDGIDEDCDGDTDCADSDCRAADPTCDASEDFLVGTSCGDGIDNDGDGYIDCGDDDCFCDDLQCPRPRGSKVNFCDNDLTCEPAQGETTVTCSGDCP